MKPEWRLFDARARKEYNNLTLERIVVYLTALSPEQWKVFFVWKPGFAQWVKVTEYAELKGRLVALTAPEAPPFPDLARETEQAAVADRSSPQAQPPIEVQSEPYGIEFEVQPQDRVQQASVQARSEVQVQPDPVQFRSEVEVQQAPVQFQSEVEVQQAPVQFQPVHHFEVESATALEPAAEAQPKTGADFDFQSSALASVEVESGALASVEMKSESAAPIELQPQQTVAAVQPDAGTQPPAFSPEQVPAAAQPPVFSPPSAPAFAPPSAPPAQAAQAAQPENRRKHTRVELRLKVVIVAGNRSFRSFTQDVSLGGFLLETPLPWREAPGHCHVFISGPEGEHSIEFRARAILTNQDNRLRVAFEEVDERFQERLAAWISEARKKFGSTEAAA